MKPTLFRKLDKKELYNFTLASANAKDKKVYILEKGSLLDFFCEKDAEKVRNEFLKNNIQIQQITNDFTLKKFSKNEDYINKSMLFRYIPTSIFEIDHEIVIFDDIVGIYNKEEILIIENNFYAHSQRQLFSSLWDQGISPSLEFEYRPNHSFYNCLDYFYKGVQIIIWPDADAKESYNNFTSNDLNDYVVDIINSDPKYYKNASYIIGFIWSYNGQKMIDIWKFNENHVDDRSGPLGDVRVYKDKELCSNIGLASGNTLLVLGYEEKMRRQSKDLKSYLNGPVPKLPLEIMNGKDFF